MTFATVLADPLPPICVFPLADPMLFCHLAMDCPTCMLHPQHQGPRHSWSFCFTIKVDTQPMLKAWCHPDDVSSSAVLCTPASRD